MTEFVYLNGDIMPADAARVSVFDAGFTHAAGLFETLRAYSGRVMRLPEHIDRMARSAAVLEMNMSIDQAAIADGIARLLVANELTDARIRVVATPGDIPRPGANISPTPTPTLTISATALQPYPAELYRQGMRVCICPFRQNQLDPLAGHKTLAYLPRLLAMKEAADRKCGESLWFTTDNRLAEGSVCNVFIVRDRILWTPPLDTPILAGTTRNSIIESAQAEGLEVHEQSIDINGLLAATEVFLTGSVLEVMPVTAIEKHQVGEGEPGPVTKKVSELYRALVAKECGLG